MQHISSSEFKSRLEKYLVQSSIEPIMVERAGKPIAVVMSPTEFEQLQRIEDMCWIARAESAEHAGESIDHAETFRLLASRLENAH